MGGSIAPQDGNQAAVIEADEPALSVGLGESVARPEPAARETSQSLNT
jgi:hypothetical protein